MVMGAVERTSRIKLKIPAGIDEGARLRSAGGGEAGLRAAAAAIFMWLST